MAALTSADLAGLLLRHRLLSSPQQSELNALADRLPEGRAFLRELTRRGWLTAFQAEALLQGRAADLLLGPYVLLGLLGSGGMGRVYRAREAASGEVVALKVIKAEVVARPNAVQRFLRECRAVAQLDHPNVARSRGTGQARETYFLAMEYVEGTDLGRVVQERGPLAVGLACEYARQAALGLQHAHEQGLVHRDIKPGNLRVTQDGRQVKILDFGLARFESEAGLEDRLTQLGRMVGTVDFIAPEQALDSRKADIRADIYSLGCSLFFLLTGRPPFEGEDPLERLSTRLKDKAPSARALRAEVPAELDTVLVRLMAREPAKRYQTPAEAGAALEPFAVPPTAPVSKPVRAAAGRTGEDTRPTEEATPWSDLGPSRRRRRGKKGRWGWAEAFVGALVVLVVVMVPFLLGSRTTQEQPEGEQPKRETPIAEGPKPAPVGEKQPGQLARPQSKEGFRLARPHALTLEPGQRVSAALFVERQGYAGPLNVQIESAPPGVTATAGPIPEGAALGLIELKAAENGKGTDGAVRLRVSGPGGQVEESLPVAVAGEAWRIEGKLFGHIRAYPLAQKDLLLLWTGPFEVWDLRQKARVWTVLEDRPTQRPQDVSADGERVLLRDFKTGQERIELLDVAAGKVLPAATKPGNFRAAALSPDGKRFLTVDANGALIVLWDVAGQELARLVHPPGVQALAFTPDGRRVLTASADRINRLWDLETRKVVGELHGRTDEQVVALAVSPDGRLALSCGGPKDPLVRVWELETGQEKMRLVHNGTVRNVVFSADGKWIASSVNQEKRALLWDADGPLVCQLYTENNVEGLAFSPDGSQLLVGCSSGTPTDRKYTLHRLAVPR
jgi:hypothetical protein